MISCVNEFKMKIEKYTPSELLKPFIKSFLIIESEDGNINRTLPDTSVVLAFRYKGMIYEGKESKNILPPSVISGIKGSVNFFNYYKETAALLTLFKEGGASAFFNQSLNELFNSHIPLENFITLEKLEETEELLSSAENNIQRIYVIEKFLLSNLLKREKDILIDYAVQKIKASNGIIKIKELASFLNISQDPLEKKFRRIIGTSPKQFSTIIRLRNLIKNHSQSKTFTEAALSAGYFD